jgi:hypothetical protein
MVSLQEFMNLPQGFMSLRGLFVILGQARLNFSQSRATGVLAIRNESFVQIHGRFVVVDCLRVLIQGLGASPQNSLKVIPQDRLLLAPFSQIFVPRLDVALPMSVVRVNVRPIHTGHHDLLGRAIVAASRLSEAAAGDAPTGFVAHETCLIR